MGSVDHGSDRPEGDERHREVLCQGVVEKLGRQPLNSRRGDGEEVADRGDGATEDTDLLAVGGQLLLELLKLGAEVHLELSLAVGVIRVQSALLLLQRDSEKGAAGT